MSARGDVTKNDDPGGLLAAVDRVLGGEIFLGQIPGAGEGCTRGGGAAIAEKERAILKALAAGKDLAEISHELGSSYKTIANSRAAMRKKLGLRSNIALVKYAIEQQPWPARLGRPR